MSNDRKKEFAMYSVPELKSLETHFADMAEKGWLIDKLSLWFFEYKKIEPKKLIFFVDILPKITAFDYPNNNDAQEYRQICEQSGWIFQAYSKQVQIFYTTVENHMAIPIHTDKRIEAKIIMKACLKSDLIIFFYGLVVFWFGWGGVIGKGYSLFLSNIAISQGLSVIIITIPYLWYCIFLLGWYVKASICAKKGLPLSKVNYKIARIRGITFAVSGILIIVLMLGGLLLELFGGMPGIFMLLMFPVLGTPIGLYFRNQVDTKERSRKENKIRFAIMMAVILVMGIGTSFFVMQYVFRHAVDSSTIPQDREALKLSAVGIETPPDIYNYYNNRASIAVPLNYRYYEINAEGSVHTELIKAVNHHLADKLFQEMLEETKEKQWVVLTEMSGEEAQSWGAAKGYYLNELKKEALLLYDKTILKVDYSGEKIQMSNVQKKVLSMGFE